MLIDATQSLWIKKEKRKIKVLAKSFALVRRSYLVCVSLQISMLPDNHEMKNRVRYGKIWGNNSNKINAHLQCSFFKVQVLMLFQFSCRCAEIKDKQLNLSLEGLDADWFTAQVYLRQLMTMFCFWCLQCQAVNTSNSAQFG